MSTKKTPWFDGSVNPVHVGVYERDDTGTMMQDGEPNYSYWDGARWGCSRTTASGAREVSMYTSDYQDLPWRGIEQQPEEA